MQAPGQLEWTDVDEPDLESAGQALVKPLIVATCDLDGPIVNGETPIPGPIALGHEGIAEVIAVGDDVQSVKPGDHVVVPFQISCGSCPNCLAGLTGSCLSVPERSMFGFGLVGGNWGGMLSDLLRVPYADAMLVKAPGGINPLSIASASDNLPDAWRTVAPYLRNSPDSEVLILGGGARSISLYAVGIAIELGCPRVTYIDTDPGRLALASDLGADTIEGPPPEHPKERYPVVVDGGASHESLTCACRATRSGGNCTHVGIIYEEKTPVPLLEMYTVSMTLHVGRAMARRDLPEVLELVGRGGFDPARINDRVVPFEEASTALLEPHTKLIFSHVL